MIKIAYFGVGWGGGCGWVCVGVWVGGCAFICLYVFYTTLFSVMLLLSFIYVFLFLFCTLSEIAIIKMLSQSISVFCGQSLVIWYRTFGWQTYFSSTSSSFAVHHDNVLQKCIHITNLQTMKALTFQYLWRIISCVFSYRSDNQGAVSIRKTVLPGMAIPMLKIRRPNGRLIFNMEITIRR